MQPSEERIYYLLNAYSERTATADEEKELLEWAASDAEDDILKRHIQHLIEATNAKDMTDVDWNKIYKEISEKIRKDTWLIQPRYFKWSRVAAAVAIVVAGVSIWILYHKRSAATTAIATTTSIFKNDIKPGTDKAILQVGNRQVVLSKRDTSFIMAGNRISVRDGNVKIADSRPVQYTLITPRGGTYSLMLPDGTKAWLNADSKLVYPSVFTGNTRQVLLTGEAYFNVKTDEDHPFIVKTAEQRVIVLGTEFNINAYPGGSGVVTTLVQGKVQINTPAAQLILTPGQQAESDRSGHVNVNPEADVEEVVAWKSGYFRFDRADIHSIMTQLARWYNIRVDYEPGLKVHYFGAIMNRNNNISQILSMLSATGEVHFKVEGDIVTVMR